MASRRERRNRRMRSRLVPTHNLAKRCVVRFWGRLKAESTNLQLSPRTTHPVHRGVPNRLATV